jgi:hypothetical protein
MLRVQVISRDAGMSLTTLRVCYVRTYNCWRHSLIIRDHSEGVRPKKIQLGPVCVAAR